jgi:diguanylate cyclase (GGDEF)-like protein
MGSGPASWLHGRAARVRGWPVWALPRWLAIYVVLVTAADAAAIAAAGRMTPLRPAHLLLFALLLGCSAVTVEMTRRAGENAGLIKDVFGVWELPIAILLPPFYALLAPIPRIALAQWRIRALPVYRRVFTAAAIGLSYGSASLAFRVIAHALGGSAAGHDAGRPLWILAVAACGALQWAVNNCLILPAIKGSDPAARIHDLLLAPERIHNDLTELCAAVLVTAGAAFTLVTLAFALPLVTVLQRSSRHAQLISESRIDAKTGLLNAGAWQREASAEVARAGRSRAPLAVALIDIDHFKAVNDSHGHLVGDQVLAAIARTVQMLLRPGDLVGRFGGDELAVLLPQTTGPEAGRIAERIRAHFADSVHAAASAPDTTLASCTVSIGVAAFDDAATALTEVLAAADAALYRAKHSGRNQAWITTGTTSLSGNADSEDPDTHTR